MDFRKKSGIITQYTINLLVFITEAESVYSAIRTGYLTLNLLTTTIVAPPSNARKWQMGFNSAFKGLTATYPVRP